MKRILLGLTALVSLAVFGATFPPGFVGSNISSAECVVASQTIAAISLASPAALTVTTHNLKTGDVVKLTNGDMNELAETYYTITKTGADTFTIPICTKSLVATTAVSVANDTITITGHGWANDQAFIYNNGGGASLAPLVSGTTYYARNVSANTLQVSATADGATIDLTGTGNSSQYCTFTTYTAGGTCASGYLSVASSVQYVSLYNGNSLHASSGPVYLVYSAISRPSAPTVADPSTCDLIDPNQGSDVPAGIKYISMSVAAGQKAWVRYRLIY